MLSFIILSSWTLDNKMFIQHCKCSDALDANKNKSIVLLTPVDGKCLLQAVL